ncbi:MAG: alpha/beta hydrolase [Ginsengibacter sp.]
MRFQFFPILAIMFFLSPDVHAQKEIPLYNGQVPNSKPDTVTEKKLGDGNGGYHYTNVHQPTLTYFPADADKANGTAVIICPGGGYSGLSFTHEGIQVAQLFQKMGVAAFVLKYRLPSNGSMVDKSIGPLQDAQRAIQMVKANAQNWSVDSSRVGILGFSAGGHLASTAGTHFNHSSIDNAKNISLRPAFMILGYPVISFADSLTHWSSRNNLIGKNASKEVVIKFSNELQVTSETPPAFIFHAGNDETVKVENSILFYQALHKNGVRAELIIYPAGGHGFGLTNPTTTSKWIDECQKWMMSNGWLNKSSSKK